MKNRSPDHLKDAVKALLKNKDLGYAELAAHLKVSLPTVKRILGPEELTLSRLLEICDWLGVSLGELEILAGHHADSKSVRFTPRQEEFFVDHPNYLSYLALLHSGDLPEKIAATHGLTEKSTELYLLGLEKLELLHRDAKRRVRLTHKEFPSLTPDGPLVVSQYRSLIQQSSDFFARHIGKILARRNAKGLRDDNTKTWMSFSMMKLSRSTFEEWEKKQSELLREIAQRADLEDKLGTIADPCQMVVSHLHTALEPDDPEVEGLKTTLGRITNLEKRPVFPAR